MNDDELNELIARHKSEVASLVSSMRWTYKALELEIKSLKAGVREAIRLTVTDEPFNIKDISLSGDAWAMVS
jgi:hypothetical protein